jgi:quercetin dioxygenase-like cupin family protein
MLTPFARNNRKPETSRILLGSASSGGRFALVEIITPRGSEPPLHRHRHEDLTIITVDGHLTFFVNGCALPASPGTCVHLPRRSVHGYAVESETAHLLAILVPAGAEEFLIALHESILPKASISNQGASAAIERLIAFAARHDIDITGPRPPGDAPGISIPDTAPARESSIDLVSKAEHRTRDQVNGSGLPWKDEIRPGG